MAERAGGEPVPLIEERYFSDIQACGEALAESLAACVERNLARKGRASLAVSGGRTPRWVFPALAAMPLAWEKVAVTLTDERWVDADDPQSNEKLVRDLLLVDHAASARFTGLKTADETPEEGVGDCRRRLADFPWPLDALFLGLGEDGHIASLFPGRELDLATDVSCLATEAPGGGPARMSLAPAVLLAAGEIFLILAGAAKRSAYRRAKRPGPFSELPVRLVLHQDRSPVTVFIARKNGDSI